MFVISISLPVELEPKDRWKDGHHFKGSPDPSHFILEIIFGKSRIRHKTTLKLNENRLKMTSFQFRVALCQIRLFPTLISKIKWLVSRLSLKL